MDRTSEKMCPRCTTQRLKPWDKLSDEQKMLAERLPASAEASVPERRTRMFCTRCWFERSAIDDIEHFA